MGNIEGHICKRHVRHPAHEKVPVHGCFVQTEVETLRCKVIVHCFSAQLCRYQNMGPASAGLQASNARNEQGKCATERKTVRPSLSHQRVMAHGL